MNTGRLYDPATGLWTSMTTTAAPTARDGHSAVWTGAAMVVWGGFSGDISGDIERTGGAFDPATDTWTSIRDGQAPDRRLEQSAVWTGTEMIVWGGWSGEVYDTGGIHDPPTNSWTPTSTTGAPAARHNHNALWTGSKMIVWGGTGAFGVYLNTGGIYDPRGGVRLPARFYTVTPCRVTDTRLTYDILLDGMNRSYPIAGACDIPGGAKAVSVNVTVLPTEAGHLRLYPLGGPLPSSSAINFGAGRVRANSAVIALGDGGALGVHAHQPGLGHVDLILDVSGYFQ